MILLAAGRGERLWPLTSNKPKSLLPILCKPLLHWHLETLSEFDNGHISIVIGYMSEKIKDSLKNNQHQDVELIFQETPIGTADAVKKVFEQTNKTDEYVLVAYSDIFIQPPVVSSIMNELKKNKPSILGVRVSDVSQLGELVVSKENKLLSIKEKPGERRPGIINGGLMILPTEELINALTKVKLSARGEYELTDALSSLANIMDINVITVSEKDWSDVGTPWNYLETNRLTLRNVCGDKKECILGEKYLEPRGDYYIEDRVFIGGLVEIGPYAHLRGDNILCGDNKIGFSTQVKSSLFLHGARAPHLNYVGDSVLGCNVNLGAGAITANLRHDEKPIKSMLKGILISTGMRKLGAIIGDEVKVGINVSILPGVKIGFKAWINSGCIIDRDVPDYSIVNCKQTHELISREAKNEEN